jgi:2-keto-3-deoxy-L-rhamnonate aldolase RhmA
MRVRLTIGALGLLLCGGAAPAGAQAGERLNPMITLLEQGLPVLGISHPAINAGRGRGAGADGPPPAPPVLSEVARQTVAYRLGDYEYNSYSPASAERFREYMEAILAAGGSMRTHPFISKVPIFHRDPATATARIHEQLDAGHVGIWMEGVESAEEVRQAIAAMRLRSRGGTRPDEGVGFAARYWGLSEAEYREKADVWPLDPNGELLVYVIVESREGIRNVREIAAVPGVSVISVGAGTLGGVFSSIDAEGQRVRDQEGFDAGVAAIVAACKEFDVVCGYPANNPADVERLMGEGYRLFTMQSRNDAAFEAVLTGRRLSGRPATP